MEAEPTLRSLADKVNWLIDRARPAGRGPCSNAEVADLIERTTGERVSYTTIWKLRNGQAANPQMKLRLSRGELAVPGQQRRGCHEKDLCPAPAGKKPRQRGEPHPVGRLVSYAAEVAAQHRVLVPEHQ